MPRVKDKDRERRGLRVACSSAGIQENKEGKRRGRERCRSLNNAEIGTSLLGSKKGKNPGLVSIVRVVRERTQALQLGGMWFGRQRRGRLWDVDNLAKRFGGIAWGQVGVAPGDMPRRRLVVGARESIFISSEAMVQEVKTIVPACVGIGIVSYEGNAKLSQEKVGAYLLLPYVQVRWIRDTVAPEAVPTNANSNRVGKQSVVSQAIERRFLAHGDLVSWVNDENNKYTVMERAQGCRRGERRGDRKRKIRFSVPKK